MPNVLSPRDLVFRPDNMDETVPHKRLWNCFILQLFILQTPLNKAFSGGARIYCHTTCAQQVNAVARMCGCTGLPASPFVGHLSVNDVPNSSKNILLHKKKLLFNFLQMERTILG